MSDIEAMQTENEALKAKNAELLGKLRKAKDGGGESQERLGALEAENEQLKAEIHKLTFENPVNEFFKNVCPASNALRQTFSDHFDIARGDDGKFYINDKDGNPMLKTVKVGQYGEEHHPRELTFDNLYDLVDEHGLDDLWFFMPKPTGSGAPGSTHRNASRPPANDDKPADKPLNRPQLGMR
ncbi:cell division protein ZapB [Salinicola sp. MIT1003]|uniref:cell division protein ZapB n=1 Tax=Salinicola sp. MIT1003 TaxID=1882734 RepID=UPI0008DD681A|nr:cell division protein ZapB [Salinicola sp. MIT1003]OHZ02882.1 hypothetical protein BC443_14360 [Salinicola sp. MIT1003]